MYVIRLIPANAYCFVKVDSDNVDKDDSSCSAILCVNVLSKDEFQLIHLFKTS